MKPHLPVPRLDYSALDSERFGRRIYRAALTSVDADALHDALRRERVDTLIARIPAVRVGEFAALANVDLVPIVADTQVHYEIALEKFIPPPDRAKVELVDVDDAGREHLRAIAREIFQGYASHYSANPLLDASAIADGYADWAARLAGDAKSHAWFVQVGGTPIGFSACRVDTDTGTAHGLLNGILPASRGEGNYRAMLSLMLQYFRNAGSRAFAITTQVHNTTVQRAWAVTGFRLLHAENTVHINSNFGDMSKSQTDLSS